MPLIDNIYNFFVKMKSGSEFLVYGRPILRGWIAEEVASCRTDTPRILDIGCGQGEDLEHARAALGRNCELFGIEEYAPYRETCRKKDIQAQGLNIEREALPFPDEFFDVILINQVLEHTKDIFFILSEISRTLKKEGLLLVGLPNLAAWHDRLLLLIGEQPSGMKVLGPHIRGMTLPGFRRFIECDGYFRLLETRGSGFYPFPVAASQVLANAFPNLATSLFYKLRRTSKPGLFIEVLRQRRFETNYYQGEPDPKTGSSL